MPKQSNEFQQVIYLLQQQLRGKALVTESKMLIDRHTGAATEVDVVVEGEAGGVGITIGIECVGRSRKATVEWVNQMHAKHGALPIHKTVLVAEKGFTKNALKKARALNMEPLTITEAAATKWANVVGSLDGVVLGTFELQFKSATLRYAIGHEVPPEELQGSSRVVLQSGASTTLLELVNQVLALPSVGPEVMRSWHALPDAQRKNPYPFQLEWPFPPGSYLAAPSGQAPVVSLLVQAEASIVATPVTLKAGDYGGRYVVYGTAKNIFKNSAAPERRVVMTFTQGEAPLPKMAMLIPKYQGGDDRIFEPDARMADAEDSGREGGNNEGAPG